MKKTILLLLLAAALAANAETVFIEAESFDDWGGWVNDTQFMDQMGSPYLLAHGLGNPVADAKTKFVATGGRYNIWVRTKNWTAPWHSGTGAGTFNLIINGEMLPDLLGCQGTGEWLWVKAGGVTPQTGVEYTFRIKFDYQIGIYCVYILNNGAWVPLVHSSKFSRFPLVSSGRTLNSIGFDGDGYLRSILATS